MPRVLLADDSDVMLQAMRKLIAEEPRIEIVGEASTFAQTIQMITGFRPEILVLDLHMAEKRDFAPALVKAQLACVAHVLAVSFAIDSEAKALAESYGAEILLDKMHLYGQLVPEILHRHPTVHSERAGAAAANG